MRESTQTPYRLNNTSKAVLPTVTYGLPRFTAGRTGRSPATACSGLGTRGRRGPLAEPEAGRQRARVFAQGSSPITR